MPRGVSPVRSRDPARILPLVERDGAAILLGWGTTAADALSAARAIFGSILLSAPTATEVIPADGRRLASTGVAHTDGWSLGDRYPDYVLLSCAAGSRDGGDSFVIDGEAVVDHLASGPDGRDLVQRLQTVTVDHSGPDGKRRLSTVIARTIAGRLMLRRFPSQRPNPTSDAPEEDTRMLARWRDTIDNAAAVAPRFTLRPGEVVVVDNYRMMHGSDPCTDGDRRWWRVWAWTTGAYGLPGRERSFDRRAVAS